MLLVRMSQVDAGFAKSSVLGMEGECPELSQHQDAGHSDHGALCVRLKWFLLDHLFRRPLPQHTRRDTSACQFGCSCPVDSDTSHRKTMNYHSG